MLERCAQREIIVEGSDYKYMLCLLVVSEAQYVLPVSLNTLSLFIYIRSIISLTFSTIYNRKLKYGRGVLYASTVASKDCLL